MDLRETDEQQFLRRAVREFAETEIRPNVMTWDEAQAFPRDLVPKLAAVGLMGIQVPEALGGSGQSAVSYCICIEELARVDPSIALSIAAHNGLAVAHLAYFGNEGQKAQFLKPLADGTQLGAWALTESSSGSDAASMRTSARRDGTDWVISGAKQFITNGALGDTMVVMAVTDREQGSRGISAFIVSRGNPGLKAGKKENKWECASDTSVRWCSMTAACPPGDHRRAGRGIPAGDAGARAGRIGIAALAVGWRRVPRRPAGITERRASASASASSRRSAGKLPT
jgi:alkylation response protein AidB-like acyl-CoA dehydrogenase